MTESLAPPRCGWERLYVQTVMGADTGADLDFLVGSSRGRATRTEHRSPAAADRAGWEPGCGRSPLDM